MRAMVSSTPRLIAVSSDVASRVTARAAQLSVLVAVLLIALKGWAWFMSGSISMLASLADSTLDLAASLFTYFAVRYAAAPPDREHRFGHGKAEAFAGLMQAGLVGVSAILIGVQATGRLIAPQPISHGEEGLAVMALSMLLTGGLIFAQTRALKQTGSVATEGDRAHYASDLAANAVAMIGIGAGAFLSLTWVDAAAGLLIAAWLAFGAYGVAKRAADHLLDRELADADRERIKALALEGGDIRAVHELRTRASGIYLHIQLHADIDPTISLEAVHKIMVAAEERIRAIYPAADIIIHPDPRGRAEPHGHEHFEERRASGS